MVHGKGARAATARDAVARDMPLARRTNSLPPCVIGDYSGMKDGDGVFCLNFRADRARQILRAFGEPGFSEFDIGRRPDLTLLGMVDYSKDHDRFMTRRLSQAPRRQHDRLLGGAARACGSSASPRPRNTRT
jgi:2,3-bisphosphoglycerate-independent phosphoglycerate mutase